MSTTTMTTPTIMMRGSASRFLKYMNMSTTTMTTPTIMMSTTTTTWRSLHLGVDEGELRVIIKMARRKQAIRKRKAKGRKTLKITRKMPRRVETEREVRGMVKIRVKERRVETERTGKVKTGKLKEELQGRVQRELENRKERYQKLKSKQPRKRPRKQKRIKKMQRNRLKEKPRKMKQRSLQMVKRRTKEGVVKNWPEEDAIEEHVGEVDLCPRQDN